MISRYTCKAGWRPHVRTALALITSIASAATLLAQQPPTTPAPAPTAAPEDDELYVLSPFEVSAKEDKGYTAANSLSGGRIDTPLKESAAAITAYNRTFLDDIGAFSAVDTARWAPNASNKNDLPGNKSDPFGGYSTSMRGLETAYTMRNYFKCYWDADYFSIERMDFARGPNSIMYGDTGIGGTANVSTKVAKPKPRYSVELTLSSYGGYRTTIDVNQPINKKLYMRVAAASMDINGWQDNTVSKRNSVFGTVTYKPYKDTSIRLESEYGVLDTSYNDRPVDGFSNWRGLDTDYVSTAGTMPAGGGVDRVGNQRIFTIVGHPEYGMVNKYNWGETNPYNYTNYGYQLRQGTSSQIPYAYNNGTPVVRPYMTGLGSYSEGFTPKNLTIHQPVSATMLHVDQRLGDFYVQLAGAYITSSRKIPEGFYYQNMQMDVNRFIPKADGSLVANPFMGQRYVELGGLGGDQKQSNEMTEIRLSAAYIKDLERMKLRVLGNIYQREGLYEGQTNRIQLKEAALKTPYNTIATPPPASPTAQWTWVPTGGNFSANDANKPYYRIYENERKNVEFNPAGVGSYLIPAGVTTGGVTPGTYDGSTFVGRYNSVRSEDSTKGFQLAVGGDFDLFTKRSLHLLAGVRRDQMELSTIDGQQWAKTTVVNEAKAAYRSWLGSHPGDTAGAQAALDNTLNTRYAGIYDPVLGLFQKNVPPTVQFADIANTTFTGGGVIDVSKEISFYGNYAESFDAPQQYVNIQGQTLPFRISQGVDVGVKFTFMNGKLNGSIGKYWNKMQNANQPGKAGDINGIWQTLADGLSDVNFIGRKVAEGYRDTYDIKGEGIEFILNANPTPNWNLTFNYSVPKNSQTNGVPETKAYYGANRAEWLGYTSNMSNTLTQQQRDSINNTVNLNLPNYINSFADGRARNGLFAYTCNLFTKYTFSKGWLNNAAIGGGVNIRGEGLTGNYADSPFHYFYQRPYEMYTLTLGYKFKVAKRWMNMQLTVNNVFDSETLTLQGNPTIKNGGPEYTNSYWVQSPRQFVLRTTYDF